MSLQQQLASLIDGIGDDNKALKALIGNLANLQTTNKTNLVLALNEVFGLINTNGGTAVIDDAATAGSAKVYSIDKLKSEIAAAKLAVKNEILNGAGSAYDTLLEIETYLNNNSSLISGITGAIAKRVSIEPTSYTIEQQAQTRTNIGALSVVEMGDPNTDLLALYNAAKA